MTYLARSFYDNIAMGAYSTIVPWNKLGYTPTVTTTESDLWSAAGVYVFPTSATLQMEVLSDLATADVDVGTILFNATADAGGSTTTLLDATYDFTSGAGRADIGDIIICDKSGTTPEWGILTAVANGSVSFAGGLSSGGVGTSRVYQILDVSAAKGAMAVKIDYLTSAFAAKTEIVILATTTPVALISADTYRVNSFRVIAVGTKATALNGPGGNLTLRKNGGLTYSYILLSRTRARNNTYTVPAGKTLYLTAWNSGAGKTASGNDYTRFYIRANVEPATLLNTGLLMYPIMETATQGSIDTTLTLPLKFPQKTDIKVSVVTSATTGTNIATSVTRGFLTTP